MTTSTAPYGPSHARSFVGGRDEAYAFCKDLTFRHAKTFYFASHMLPAEKRRACYAVYAFCRYIDDLVDVAAARGSVTPDDALVIIEQWRTAIRGAYAGTTTPHPIIIAWEDTVRHFSIPPSLPEELIEGVLMDTSCTRLATFADLYEYCYKVASVVGLMTTPIFRAIDERATTHAVSLGIAMQLTNILRDVREDAAMGRIYLPQDDLRLYGVSEEEILRGVQTDALTALIRDYCARAEAYYDHADLGIPMLERNSRLTVTLMSMNYRAIITKIANRGYDVMSGRVSTSLAEKLLRLPTALARVAMRSSIADDATIRRCSEEIRV